MNNAKPSPLIKPDEKRLSKVKGPYRVVRFDAYCFINHDQTWIVEYEDGSRFNRPESVILEDRVIENQAEIPDWDRLTQL